MAANCIAESHVFARCTSQILTTADDNTSGSTSHTLTPDISRNK